MKKILILILNILRGFLFNSFWKSWPVILILVLSILLNGILWYLFKVKIKENSLPFVFSSGLILLNLILGNFLWEKEKLASIFLISIGLFTQILMLIFIRFLMLIF